MIFRNHEIEPDIENMTLKEYLDFKEDYNNWVRIGVENLRKQVEGYDKGNMDDIWDITVEDVKRLRKLLTSTIHILPKPDHVMQPYVPHDVKVVREEEPDNDVVSISIQVPDVMDNVIQPLIPQTLHTTPPDKDYVALATKSILDELLQEFGDEILDITIVDKEANFNPTRDIEELERLIATDHETSFIEIKPGSADSITLMEPASAKVRRRSLLVLDENFWLVGAVIGIINGGVRIGNDGGADIESGGCGFGNAGFYGVGRLYGPKVSYVGWCGGKFFRADQFYGRIGEQGVNVLGHGERGERTLVFRKGRRRKTPRGGGF
ncbi:hypothetical protein Tco_0604447 [Tanacetum coccineum]